jgi:hypothetical protein
MTQADFGAWVRSRLAEYLDGKSSLPPGFERVAAERGLLPLGDDLANAYFVDGSGSLFWEDALEPEAGITRMEDERERTATLRGYGRDNPILLSLLPPRPPGAVTCSQCGGSGLMPLQSVEQRTFEVPCSVCAGLGWQV